MTEARTSEHSTDAPPRTRALIEQVAWFNRLRFVAVVGMVVFTSVAWWIELIREPFPLFVLAGITLLLNACYSWCFPRLAAVTFRRIRRHADLQIGLDLLILTAMLHFSGGSTNPFAFFFIFHSFIAAQILSVRTGLAVAMASIALVGGLGLLELNGWLPPVPIGLRLLDLQTAGFVGFGSWLLALGLTLGISIYFVATVLRQVRHRDEQLRRLNLQLGQSEKLASIGTLAAGVAHEINNPVGVIRNKAQILRYRIEDGDDATELLGELNTIEKHTDRIGAITQGLLTFSKESTFELLPVDVNKLIREAVDLVRAPFKEEDVQLHVRTAKWPIWVLGSENHLLQVLVNILLNARDASPAGRSVQIEVMAEDGMATLRIVDEGEGIPAEHLAKIFDPFFTTKDVDRGTGLGLAITHGIVERHLGTVTVRSQVGRGSVFQVQLPLHE